MILCMLYESLCTYSENLLIQIFRRGLTVHAQYQMMSRRRRSRSATYKITETYNIFALLALKHIKRKENSYVLFYLNFSSRIHE